MNIYGVGVVQNEADVIRDSLAWAVRFCRRIRIWDLGSTDGTWEILQGMAGDRIEVFRKEGLPYASSLRGRIAEEWRAELGEGAWIFILDADEFLVGDPVPVLAEAEQRGASLVGVWQVNFFPTAGTLLDIERLGEPAWAGQTLERRFRHYRVEWFEWRFVRLARDLVWDTEGLYSSFRLASGEPPRRSRRAMVVRHYRYRSPAQVARRFASRTAVEPGAPNRFRYEKTGDFAELVRPVSQCREWPDPDRELVVPRREILRARGHMVWVRLLRRIERTRRGM
jgi:hypothetical protein